MADSFADFHKKLEALERDLSGQTSAAGMARIGKKLEPLIDRAVIGTLGDLSMSGWTRSSPIQITGSSKVLSDHEVRIEPVGKAKGPMAVLQRGRNMGNAAGFAGPGVNRSTGATARNKNGSLRKVRSFKAKRWNGYTQPKGTMGAASEAIAREAPRLVDLEVARAIKSHLKG